MLDRFTGAPDVFITLVNGLHTESLSPGVLQRYVEFLQLYVAEQVPDVAAANVIAPILVPSVFGVESTSTFTNRFDAMSYEEALAAFEDEPAVRLLVEQGGSADTVPGAPVANFTVEQAAWPVPGAVPTSWYLGDGGTLTAEPAPSAGTDDYLADPDAVAATFYDPADNPIWNADVTWDWPALADGTGLGFTTEPFTDDTFVAGSGSVDLWVGSSSGDTDLEVTVTEVRPDGTEIYVQSGWLRASQRALDDAASTELRPVHTHLEADAAPLDDGELTLARVEVFPFTHPFRAGSRLRLTVDAPGGNRPVWAFDTTISNGETVTVGHGGETPSRLVLAVVPGVDVAAPAPPACGALRGQPCRAWVPATNGG
jgi:predicted acyl esterase